MKKSELENKYESTADRAYERRKKRARETRTLAALICLVIMTSVLYIAMLIFSWINKKMDEEGGSLPVIGDAVSGSQEGEDGDGPEGEGADGSQGGQTAGNGEGTGENPDATDAVSTGLVYSQEELDGYVASARQQGSAEVLDSIKTGLSEGDTVLETLKPLYPDDIVVHSGGKYHFVPIDRSLKLNGFDKANLNILETGEYQYMQDGQVISHKGIDVSRHQGAIDWNLVAQDGVEFAFIRVGNRGYGTGKMVEDDRFDENIQGALAAGIKVGVYYYSQAITSQEVLEEANFVLEKIKSYDIQCPVVYDVEKVSGEPGRMNDISVEQRTEFARLFCETVKNAGYRPMIYYNTEMGALMLQLAPLEEYDKWFAAYSDTFYYPYEYKVWQYSQSGTVQGIQGAVDLNISFAPLWEE